MILRSSEHCALPLGNASTGNHLGENAPLTSQPTQDSKADETTQRSNGLSGGVGKDQERANRLAQLRVPTSRKACSWWNPTFWSIARPTDYCYGDCVPFFFGSQPVSLSVPEYINLWWRREEMEYDVEEGENYVAAAINRFRRSWYDLHIQTSLWRATETTSSIHTFLKTPGAYGYARNCTELSPKMLEDRVVIVHVFF